MLGFTQLRFRWIDNARILTCSDASEKSETHSMACCLAYDIARPME